MKWTAFFLRMRKVKWMTYRTARILIGIIVGTAVFGGLLYAFRFGFKVTHIEFVGEGMHVQFNERMMTGNIIFFPSEKIRTMLLLEYPQFQDVVIKKKFPHTIQITPILRVPFALLVSSKATYEIDKEGYVMSVGVTDPNLPELRFDVPFIRVGSVIEDKNIQSSLLFLEKTKPLLFIYAIESSDDGSSLRAFGDKTEILFTQSQNIETLSATLQTIITGVRIKGTMPKIIDVRFSKPVIQW